MRRCEDIGSGDHEVIDGPAHVLVHRAPGRSGSTLFVYYLADWACSLNPGASATAMSDP